MATPRIAPAETGSVSAGGDESIPGLTRLAGMCRAQGRLPEAEQYLRQALCRLEQGRGDSHPGLPAVLQLLAETRGEQADFAEAEALQQRACSLLQRTGDRHVRLARAWRAWADLCRRQNLAERARELNQRALDACPPEETGEIALCRLQLSAILAMQGEYQAAWEQSSQALEPCAGSNWPPATRCSALRQSAWLCEFLGRAGDAERYWRQLLDDSSSPSAGAEFQREAAESLIRSYAIQGRHEEALALGRQIAGNVLTQDHEIHLLSQLLPLALRAARYDEAHDLLRRAWLRLDSLAAQPAPAEVSEPSAASAAIPLLRRLAPAARELAGQQPAPEAVAGLQTLLRFQEAWLPADDLDLARTLDHLGRAAGMLTAPGYLDSAGRWLGQALAIRQRHWSEPHEEIAASLLHLGLWQEQRREFRPALELYQRGLAMLDLLPESACHVLPWLDRLARLARQLHELDASEAYQSRALALALELADRNSQEILGRRLRLGQLREALGRADAAEMVYCDALAEEESDAPEWREALLCLAGMYCQQCRFHEAVPLYGRCLAWLRQHPEYEPGEQLLPLERLGEMAWRSGLYQQSEDWRKQALYLRQKLAESEPDEAGLAGGYVRLAETQEALGRLDEARRHAQQAWDLGHLRPLPAASGAAASELLARAARRLGQFEEAENCYRRALAARENAGEFLPLARALEALSEVCALNRKDDEAAWLQRRALQLWQTALPADHPRVGQAWHAWARRLRNLQPLAEGRQALERARGILTRAWGPQDARLAPLWRDLAELLAQSESADDLATADRYCERALALLRPSDAAAGSPSDSAALPALDLARLWLFRAALARRRRHEEAACEYLLRARQVCSGIWPCPSISTWDESGESHAGGEQSEAVFRNAVAIWEKALGPDHPHVATSLTHLARVCAAQGKREEAEQLHRRALDIRQRLLGPSHASVAESCNHLGGVCQMLGRWDEAERWCRQALDIWEKNQKSDPSHATVSNWE